MSAPDHARQLARDAYSAEDAADAVWDLARTVDPEVDDEFTWPQYVEAISGNLTAIVHERDYAERALRHLAALMNDHRFTAGEEYLHGVIAHLDAPDPRDAEVQA